MAILSTTNTNFIRRLNRFSSNYDSICRTCGTTVASAPREAQLEFLERGHPCVIPSTEAEGLSNHSY
ncbi:hypothetical protein [Silvibacterium sp.]|uniref:hypothetical protein n=1 Tax=Silvibacterium sp. TaxID=1964179 RepID=UPI0039E5654B